MGIWDTICPICGNSCYLKDLELILKENYNIITKDINKKLNWLNNCSILLANNQIIHNVKDLNGNAIFYKNKKDAYSADIYNDNNDYFSKDFINRGIVIHTDCWKFIKLNYNIELKYKDLPINKKKYKYNEKIGNVKYNLINKYQGQFIDYPKMFIDKNIYMAYSPLDENKNASRIKKIISQFKIKDRTRTRTRTGPTISATFYKEGDIKQGNNNNFWIKKSGKWIEIKDDIINKKIELKNIHNKKKLNKIPQIGEFNNKLLFVKNYNKSYIELIGNTLLVNKIL